MLARRLTRSEKVFHRRRGKWQEGGRGRRDDRNVLLLVLKGFLVEVVVMDNVKWRRFVIGVGFAVHRIVSCVVLLRIPTITSVALCTKVQSVGEARQP